MTGVLDQRDRTLAAYDWSRTVAADDFEAVHADKLRGEINLDYAATTPALRTAADAVVRLLPAYGSIHRGGGVRSRISTDAYEWARAAVADFVGCGEGHHLVFVRNTTEAINLVAASLPQGSRILCTRSSITPTCCPGVNTTWITSRSRRRRRSSWSRQPR